jgi:pimeloyl-ACP methyl ester carboxylesterase
MPLKIVSGIIIIYLAYCVLIYTCQRQILFPRSQIPAFPALETRPAGVEISHIQMPFGKTETWFLKPEKKEGQGQIPVVIFAHGNAELIDFWPDMMRGFLLRGIGVLLVEYPGYGRSDGIPTQESITETFTAAYDHLIRRQDINASRIILFGRSVGGGAICQLAARRPSAAMILMSTFTSIRSFAHRFLAPGFLIRDPFDNQAVVSGYNNPLLLIHGRFDEIIPYSHSRHLKKAAPHARLVSYSCGHNDCPPNESVFWQDIEKFLFDAGILPASIKNGIIN